MLSNMLSFYSLYPSAPLLENGVPILESGLHLLNGSVPLLTSGVPLPTSLVPLLTSDSNGRAYDKGQKPGNHHPDP
ncbi:unnamed protein product [Clonostachys rosea f. rosea IK726]|uniref:Uncharacterized protein n=2 Tax=Clonostachys rosea f. rosea IK726 TaxID=1349383 RepID=A0ACA9UKG3_BIOOC|nr:unnamed protein product [Clonostachys rosea f. rosea IK726]CAG9953549.1 unnamed protein product [Clonostachys rosea f. rosea IK726]